MNRIVTVSKFTFHQIIRSKILLNTILLGLFLLISSYVAHEISYGARSKITLDIGLGLNYVSLMGIALFMGVGLVSDEIETRTLYMSLSRPVNRWSYFIGKLLGLSGVLVLNSLILMIFVSVGYFFVGGEFSPLIFISFFFDLLAALIVLSIVVFFSLFSNKVISLLMTITLTIAGHFLNQLSLLNFVLKRDYLNEFINVLKWFLPNLDMLNLKDLVVYFNTVPDNYILKAMGYTIFYLVFLNGISCLIFERKNLD